MNGWFLPRSRINTIQSQSIHEIVRRAKLAHYADVVLRINGKDERFQIDWLKHLERLPQGENDELQRST